MPRVTWEALPALLMPVILLGCMYSGITTPTEAAAVAAAYALLVSALLYRSVGLRDVYRSLANSARVTVSIGMLIAGALVFNYVITSENIPKTLSAALAAYQLSPLMFLISVNVLLLVLGCFLEGTTIILVILPVLTPTAAALGVDPVHFGVMCIVNIMLGLVTPPYGLLLFMMNKVTDVSMSALIREVMPFLYVMIGALVVIMLFPDLTLFLPRLLGYKGSMATTVDSRRVECVVRGADQLGETPLWCERERKLWWLDIERPKLQSFDPSSGTHEIRAVRPHHLPRQPRARRRRLAAARARPGAAPPRAVG